MQVVKNKPQLWCADVVAAQWINYLLWCMDHSKVLPGSPASFDPTYLSQLDNDYRTVITVSDQTQPLITDICLGSNQAWVNYYVTMVKHHDLDPLQSEQLLNRLSQLQQQQLNFNLDWCQIWQDPVSFLTTLGDLTQRHLAYDRISQKAIAQYSRICQWIKPEQCSSGALPTVDTWVVTAWHQLKHSLFYPEPLADPRHSGNYCPLVYAGLYVEKIDQDRMQLAACCLNRPEQKSPTKQIDFERDFGLQQQRDTLSRGLPVTDCKHCYQNVFSPQENYRVEWMSKSIDYRAPLVQKLDYNVDPICNAACVHCSSYYSSAWMAEDLKHGVPQSRRRFSMTRRSSPWSQVDLSDLKWLYFNGGEPLLSDEPLEILQHLDHLQRLSSLHLSLNTNGSVRPKDALVKLMNNCARVIWNFSIDGIENEFEYIRYPLNWLEVQDNLEFVRQLGKNVEINIACSLGIHNLDSVPRLMAWVNKLNSKSRQGQLPIKFFTNPVYGVLSLENAEPQLRRYWLEKYQESQPWWQQSREILLRPYSPALTPWSQYLEKLDQRRKLDWRQCLPQLYQSWKKSQLTINS